jgi:hypothetical protein
MGLLTTSQIHFRITRVEVCHEQFIDSNQNEGERAVTSVDRVNLIWILMKESVFSSSCAILVS